MVLDGAVQCTEKGHYAFEETIANLPLNCHPHPEKVTLLLKSSFPSIHFISFLFFFCSFYSVNFSPVVFHSYLLSTILHLILAFFFSAIFLNLNNMLFFLPSFHSLSYCLIFSVFHTPYLSYSHFFASNYPTSFLKLPGPSYRWWKWWGCPRSFKTSLGGDYCTE